MSFNYSSFYLPNPQHSVSRQAHPLLWKSLRRQRFRLGEAPPLGLGDTSFRLSETIFLGLKGVFSGLGRSHFEA